MRTLLASLLLISVTFAGCIGGPDDVVDEGDLPDEVTALWAEQAVPFGKDHDHSDISHHQDLTTPNWEVIGYDPLSTEYHGATSGTYFCGEVALEGERDLAVTHSFSTDVALVVLDVTDPAAPTMIGELSLPRVHVYDVAITDDGAYAVLGTNPPDSPDDGTPAAGAVNGAGEITETATFTTRPVWTDACGNTYQGPETELPYQAGVVLVDLSDPTSPEVADNKPTPVLGAHSIFATTIDGEHYVLASTTNLAHTASYFSFFTITETALPSTTGALGQAVLDPYGTYQSQYVDEEAGAEQETPLTNGHVDGTIQTHPVTGDLLAYLADWSGGLIILDMQGPGQLVPVGTWNDYDETAGAGMTGQIHETWPLPDLWNGRHITLIGQEVGGHPESRPSGQVILMDTTDPAEPTPLARWTLPVDIEWDGSLQFSTHYVALVDEVLYISMYHGGLWAADASEEHWPELPSIGVFIPDNEPANPPPEELSLYARWTPMVMEVLPLPDGSILTFDANTGAYTLRFDQDMTLPEVDPWTSDAWLD